MMPTLGTPRLAVLVTNRDEAKVSWVEVAHEAVLRHWQRFSNWLDANRRFLLWRKRLKAIRDSQSFLRAEALAEALGWMKDHGHHLAAEEREFIEKSRRSVRNRRLGGQIAAALALAVTAAWGKQQPGRAAPAATRGARPLLLFPRPKFHSLSVS